MHPLVTAWADYLSLAALQVSYWDRRRYAPWVVACRRKKEWVNELSRMQ